MPPDPVETTMAAPETITVYFDGLCPVCSREVTLYRWLDRRERIRWLDLAGADDVLDAEMFTLDAALEQLHVRDANGSLHLGFDAHLLMWQRLIGFRTLSRWLKRWPIVRNVAEHAYRAFTRRRPGRLLRERRLRHAGEYGHD
jgi:predicted DCC family thiol-disulfide oxidoreductase YuxK